MAFTEGGVTVTNYFATITDWSGYLNLGGVQSMGNNSYGQLGLLDVTHRSSPITITSRILTRWVSII